MKAPTRTVEIVKQHPPLVKNIDVRLLEVAGVSPCVKFKSRSSQVGWVVVVALITRITLGDVRCGDDGSCSRSLEREREERERY